MKMINKKPYIHTTPFSIPEARAIQESLRQKVVLENQFSEIKMIAGLDVGYDIQKNLSKAALITMDINELKPINSITAFGTTPFPYVPGLLSFREVPVILKALSQLHAMPDLIFVDGHGIAHPRGLGIASHIGVLTDIPTIGVAKSLLCGEYKEPAVEKGSLETLFYKGIKIGIVLRSREKVKPLFISPGHKISHESAIAFVLKCLTRYRLPEPTRLADKLSKIGN